MAIVLGIETSSEAGSVAVVNEGKVLVCIRFSQPYSHARVLGPAIQQALRFAELEKADLSAVALSAGPGSYTGLRIGASTAKGVCFGLDIPLVAVSTLQAMAAQAIGLGLDAHAAYAPMLDARRMEVYSAAYNSRLRILTDPAPVILTEGIPFLNLDSDIRVYYFGPGAAKCRDILGPEGRFRFLDGIGPDAGEIALLGEKQFLAGQIIDSASFEPDYLKAFQGKPPAPKTR